jgi:hypothetical protein
VFEQVFQAYEQQLPKAALKEYNQQGWLDPNKYPYSCPGERLVDVSFNMTPQDFSLAGLWGGAPKFLFFTFAFSFLGICLAIGIFK